MINGRAIFKKINAQGYDAAVFFDQVNQHYITGFLSTDGIVLVSEQETALFVDSRYYEAASLAKANQTMQEDVSPYLLSHRALDKLNDYIAKKSITSLAYDKTLVTVSQAEKLEKELPKIRVGGLLDICSPERQIKSEREIKSIKAAQAITDAAFTHILSFIRAGRTETEIAAELEYFCRKNGSAGMAFQTIVVSGKNSSLPHGVPSDTTITKNSFITMDFGAKLDGYCSDMTRTVVLGKADSEMRHVYNTVLEAQRLALCCVKSGVTGAEVDRAARNYINSNGYEGKFGHSTGHSLGLEIHEQPRFSSAWSEKILAGTVMTVEPGVYLPGKYGVRIEDMVLVTDAGCENLTRSDKQLTEL
jgi:Xaa-Pro aminopeptidase